jgi:hypothetical protein
MKRLQETGEGLWVVDHEAKLGPGAYLPIRMTVMRVGADELLLHSPVPIDDALAEEIDAIGRVAHILGPNKFHHLHIPKTKRRYPTATTWGAPGLAEKRSDIVFDGVLGTDAPASWRDDVVQVHVKGVPMVHEVVTFHRPSGSLVVTDLVFNMAQTRGWATGMLMAMVGASRGFAHSRSWKYVFVRDKAEAGRCVSEVLSWDFARIVPAHGDIAQGARERLGRELEYLTRAAGDASA